MTPHPQSGEGLNAARGVHHERDRAERRPVSWHAVDGESGACGASLDTSYTQKWEGTRWTERCGGCVKALARARQEATT